MEMRRKNLREREREYVVFTRVRAPNAIWDPYIRSNFVSMNLLRVLYSYMLYRRAFAMMETQVSVSVSLTHNNSSTNRWLNKRTLLKRIMQTRYSPVRKEEVEEE